MTDQFRALCAELVDIITAHANPDDCAVGYVAGVLTRARAALAEPDPKRPKDVQIDALVRDCIEENGYDLRVIVRAAPARWGKPTPVPPVDGEVAELVEWLQNEAHHYDLIGETLLCRAAELLERQALVPVSVNDALIKAECALSDISEGEHDLSSADALQWAERRCAETLDVIRPTMKQHNIRTSEWPPLPVPEVES